MFLLNDDSLSDDNYPDVVKNLVRNSRRTIREMDEHDAVPLEQQTGCGTPGCQCNGCVEFKVRDYFSDTSEEETWTDRMLKPIESVMYNDTVDTSTLSDEEYTYSQSELTGLTECDVSICDASDDDFFPNEEWPISEHMVLPRMAADNVNRTVRNKNNNRGRWSWPGSENDITSDENYNQVDRPVTELATAGAGLKNDSFSVEHAKCGEIPITKLIPVGLLDTE